MVEAEDKSAQLAVKDAILARSGIYLYSREDVKEMGLSPKLDKLVYREYRPAGVVIRSKDKFAMVPVPKDHPPVDITPDNFHQYASGITGGPIEAVDLPDGEVGLKGKIAFFTRDAYDHYMSGNKETSAGYGKKVVYSDDPETDGYDWVMTDITAVNHVAVLPQGRGGSNVCVLDKAVEQKSFGGIEMDKIRSGFLGLFGIGKTKDSNFKFSSVLMESVAKMHSIKDAAGVEKEVTSVMGYVKTLGDSEARSILVGAVADCFKHPVEVIAQKEAISKKIDELYAKCQDEDAAAVKRILDSESSEKKEEKKEEPGKEKKEEKNADSTDAAINTAVQKAFESVVNSLDEKITACVKAALGVEEKKKPGDTRPVDATDGVGISEDFSWIFK